LVYEKTHVNCQEEQSGTFSNSKWSP